MGSKLLPLQSCPCDSSQISVERADLANFRPLKCGPNDNENRSDSPGDHRNHRAEQSSSQSRLKRAKFVRGADENIVHSRNAAAHLIRSYQLNNRSADDYAYAVECA